MATRSRAWNVEDHDEPVATSSRETRTPPVLDGDGGVKATAASNTRLPWKSIAVLGTEAAVTSPSDGTSWS